MVGKQCINNAQEIIIPKLKAWWHQKKLDEGGEVESQIESDYRLVGNEGLFQEYLEMVLQFGFITIFVAPFPLAPLFALLNNWVEIRLDAQKFVCETRFSSKYKKKHCLLSKCWRYQNVVLAAALPFFCQIPHGCTFS